MFGQLRIPGDAVAVELEVELARTWADVATGDALAAAVVRDATPKPSPARPASATPTKSSRIAIRLITISLVSDSPIGVCVGDGWIRSPKSSAAHWGLPHRRLTICRELSPAAPVCDPTHAYTGQRMTRRQFQRLKLFVFLGVLVTDVTFGIALLQFGVSLLWCLIVLAFLTTLAGLGNWWMLRSLRRSLDHASAAPRADK